MTLPINVAPGDVQLDTPVEILCSYFYFKDRDIGEANRWGTTIIADSGAYSALSLGKQIDREDFHAWAHRWKDNVLWTAGLDKIGDVKGTRQNWEAARRDGLDLVPTLHYLEPPETLDWYVEQGVSLIGLGGMVPLKAEVDRLMRWLLTMFRYARDNHPHVRFHGWGTTSRKLVDNLPWYSVDSSRFASAFRFGRMELWDPRVGRYLTVQLNGRDMAGHRRLLKRHYGVTDWRNVAVSDSASRRAVGRVSFRSQQYYAEWLRSRQLVSPPAKLVGGSAGPRLVGVAVGTDGVLMPPPGPRVAGVVTTTSQALQGLSPTDSFLTPYVPAPTAGPHLVGVMQPSAQGDTISPDNKGFKRLESTTMRDDT